MLCWWTSGLTIAGASRFPRGTSSRSTSTACCASGCRIPSPSTSPTPVPWEWLAEVHDADLLERIRSGTMTRARGQRGLGLPWSEVLVERGRRSVGGTVAAARRALEHGIGMNLGGGTHHAGRDFARGYCLFNDVVVTLAQPAVGGRRRARAGRRLRRPPRRRHRPAARPRPGRVHALAARRAQLPVRADPVRPRRRPAQRAPATTSTCACSPSRSRSRSSAGTPDIAFFLAGADPWEGDRLGRLALTKAGLRARDELVLDRLLETGAAVVVVLAGGYAPDVVDTVEINAATVAAVAARDGAL